MNGTLGLSVGTESLGTYETGEIGVEGDERSKGGETGERQGVCKFLKVVAPENARKENRPYEKEIKKVGSQS